MASNRIAELIATTVMEKWPSPPNMTPHRARVFLEEFAADLVRPLWEHSGKDASDCSQNHAHPGSMAAPYGRMWAEFAPLFAEQASSVAEEKPTVAEVKRPNLEVATTRELLEELTSRVVIAPIKNTPRPK